MNFVENHMGQVRQSFLVLLEHVSKDLRGHDGHFRLWVNHHVSGDNSDFFLTVQLFELLIFLIGQGFNRRRICDASAMLDGVFN